MPAITPCLWFDNNLEEAAAFYTSIFPNFSVGDMYKASEAHPGAPGQVLWGYFVLDGTRFMGINGGPHFQFNEAVSFMVHCKDQAEVDYYWDTLTADGGEESQCGWLKDKFGLSWQVVPVGWEDMLASGDTAANQRMMDVMYGMKKLDVAALQAAYDGKPVPDTEA